MTTMSADAEGVEVQITYEQNPSPARQLLWRRLWQLLLADAPKDTNATEARPPMASDVRCDPIPHDAEHTLNRSTTTL
jgi:hypothetical protein